MGLPSPLRVVRFDTYLNTGVHVSDADAYRIVQTIHSHWEALQRDYPLLAGVPAASLAPADSPHPYHPGAARYFQDAGLWSDAHERNQARALEATR